MKIKYIISLIIILFMIFNTACFAKGSVSSHSSGARSSSTSHVTTSKPSSTPKSSSSSTSSHTTTSSTSSHFSNPFLWFMVGGAAGHVTNDNNDVNIYGEQQQSMQLYKGKVLMVGLILLILVIIIILGILYWKEYV